VTRLVPKSSHLAWVTCIVAGAFMQPSLFNPVHTISAIVIVGGLVWGTRTVAKWEGTKI
jgi:hypothetical protein